MDNTKYESKTTKINSNDIGKNVLVKGWISNFRKLGDLVFIDLRDIHGILQLKLDGKNIENSSSFLKKENVIKAKGNVVKRKNSNTNLFSGDIEIDVENNGIELISESKQSPFIIADETDGLEELRLKYKYLDIRRPKINKNLIFRSNFIKEIRNYFYNLDFKEIETPIITKPTIGGANEFQVLSNNHKGKYYSLAQSPQVYKQLLMYGGIDKYFQIAKCFRDEDSRSDRQLEFTQLDLEILWTNENEIQHLIEGLIIHLLNNSNLKNWNKVNTPFKKISYKEAMENYGSDKPDLRFENKIIDLNNIFKNTNINMFKNKDVRALFFNQIIKKDFIKELEVDLKQQGSKGLAWTRIEDGKIVDGSFKSFSEKEIDDLIKISNLKSFTIFLQADIKSNVLKFLGRVRNSVAHNLNLFDPKELNFSWVIDWPLFEKDEKTNKYIAIHNPFTKPKNNSSNVEDLIGMNYDLVLNGNEVGGGSIRINNKEEQIKVLKTLGFDDIKIEKYFGWFLEAMSFGTPEHGGIALGLDRLIAILLNQQSIRDVIAFPKMTSGIDEMTQSPIDINEK